MSGSHGRLLRRLLPHFTTAKRAVRAADASIKQPKVVKNFGDRPDGGPRVMRYAALVYGYGRRKPFDVIHIGFVESPEKLTSIGRERFNIATLSFGKNGVECQRGFP